MKDRNEKEVCDLCMEKPVDPEWVREVWDGPYDDESVLVKFCSEECEDIYLHEGDYCYFWCHGCDREVCEQSPRNGWHLQYRTHPETDEMMCLKCYEEYILEEGVPREQFEKGQLPGMFFSHGNTEATEKGFIEDPDFNNCHVDGQQKVDKICKRAMELIDGDSKVVIAYESMAIGGIEGWVTLMYQKSVESKESQESIESIESIGSKEE